eukprot:TRINITY_DN13720_c0_g1_i1.p1 TRINITY_DN13720_c0_g1~~TRINITY_DN13720_c0_g1_i1.p1  ORF type:complete len:410 (+),score=114.93 TRINITY_DN13720_c0_g1_i1:69-1232(+)
MALGGRAASAAAAHLRQAFSEAFRGGRKNISLRGRVRKELVPELDRLRLEGVPLDNAAYRQAVTICVLTDQGATARQLLDYMGEHSPGVLPDTAVYRGVVEANANRGGLQAVSEVLEQMRERRHPALDNVTTVAAVMKCIASAGAKEGTDLKLRHQVVMKLFLALRRKQLVRTATPSPLLYNKALGTTETWSHATDVLAFMRKDKVPHSVETYNALLRIARTNPEEAEELFRVMKRRKIRPNVASFTTLVTAHAKKGDYKKCVDVVQRMYAADIEANAHTFAALLTAFVPHAHDDAAMRVAEEWAQRAVNLQQASEHLFRRLMHLYAIRKDASAAEALLDQVRSQGFVVIDHIAEHYATATGKQAPRRRGLQGSRVGQIDTLMHTKK